MRQKETLSITCVDLGCGWEPTTLYLWHQQNGCLDFYLDLFTFPTAIDTAECTNITIEKVGYVIKTTAELPNRAFELPRLGFFKCKKLDMQIGEWNQSACPISRFLHTSPPNTRRGFAIITIERHSVASKRPSRWLSYQGMCEQRHQRLA